jgi:alpha-beta hydrolase superfamily lysophospholipase
MTDNQMLPAKPCSVEAASELTILLVHGSWHGAWCWERQFAPWLREQGHVVETLDLPSHGRNDARRITMHSVRDYADAVEAAIARSEQPVVVAGHSMGGFVVQKLMERRLPNLAGAVLVASAPPDGVWRLVLHLLRTRPADLLRSVLALDLYHLVREPRFVRAMFYSDQLDAQTIEQNWLPLQNESFRAFLDMLVLDLPKPVRADPALPKLIFGGELDAVFSPADVRRTAQAYGVEARLFTGMGHNLMLDKGWEKVVSELSLWVRSIT